MRRAHWRRCLVRSRSEERPLWLGSSKSNIGHTSAAAGVLGVIKMVLSLQHELLPKTLHAERPSEQIEWAGSGLALLQEARAWPREASRVRRAGVSSFGISGTNAHVVLEEAPAREAGRTREPNGAAPAEAATARLPIPLLVSGRDEAALRAQAGAVCRLAVAASRCRLGSCSEDGGVASDAFCGAGVGVGAGRGGGDGSAAGAGRGALARSGVGGRSARAGWRGVRFPRARQSVDIDGSNAAGGVVRCLPRPLRHVRRL